MSRAATSYFDFYLNGKNVSLDPQGPFAVEGKTGMLRTKDGKEVVWQLRNGELKRTSDGLQISHAEPGEKQATFLTRNGLDLSGPVTANVVLKTNGRVTSASHGGRHKKKSSLQAIAKLSLVTILQIGKD